MSPAGAAVEEASQRLVLEALGLPPSAAVGFVTGATAANSSASSPPATACSSAPGWDVEARGLIGAPPLRVLVGEEVHPSLLVALRLLGLGADGAERVAAGPQGAMRSRRARRRARAGEGRSLVCAQAGNVNTGAFDPFGAIVEAARERGECWVHVDGAFGLWAAASPSLRRARRRRRGRRLVVGRRPQVAQRPLRLRRWRSSPTAARRAARSARAPATCSRTR